MTKRTARFHIRRTRSGEYRPYLRAANGEIVAGTETYTTKAGALRWTKRRPRSGSNGSFATTSSTNPKSWSR